MNSRSIACEAGTEGSMVAPGRVGAGEVAGCVLREADCCMVIPRPYRACGPPAGARFSSQFCRRRRRSAKQFTFYNDLLCCVSPEPAHTMPTMIAHTGLP